MTEGKVLVVQLARLGDLVQTWPLLRRLRPQDQGQSPDLLADQALAALQGFGPEVGNFWGMDLAGLPGVSRRDLPGAYDQVRSLAEVVRGRKYDAVYNLNFSRVSLLLSYLAGGEIRGYRPVEGGRDFLREPWLALVYALVHSRQVNRIHLSDVFRHLAPTKEAFPGVPTWAPVQGAPVIALQLATRHFKRTWPLAAFTRLAGLLVNRLQAWVWLVGTKAEAPLGEALAAGLRPAQRERVINLQGRTNLPELAGRLRAAHLLVSGDTGTLHLAAAMGTRTVGVFLGPASCFETGPYGEGHYVFQAEPPCHPCTEAGAACPEPFCQSMITPEAVADLASSLCRGAEAPWWPTLPAGTRLYRSFLDAFGLRYGPLRAGYRFIDLVGLAYRRAGASLLGCTGPSGEFSSWSLDEKDRKHLEGLVAALKNGGAPVGVPPDLAATLLPLKAYQEEMRRQISLGRSKSQAEACLETVKQGFRAGLEELGGEVEVHKNGVLYSNAQLQRAEQKSILANSP